MSKYFDPIDIRAERTPPPEPVPVNKDLIPDVTSAFEAIDTIIAELQAGTSSLRNGALYFPEGKASPVKEALKRLKATPTSRRALREFITIAQADLTRRVATAMADHFKVFDPTIHEVFNEPK